MVIIRQVLLLSTDNRKTPLSSLVEAMDREEKVFLAEILGKSVQEDITADASIVKDQYKDLQSLSQLRVADWLRERTSRNPVLLSFLEASTNRGDATSFLMARTIEQIYRLSMPTLVAPFTFMTNLAVYIATGSKKVVEVLANSGPAGCYPLVRNWLQNQATSVLTVPSGDIINVFDNEQVIGELQNMTNLRAVQLLYSNE